MSEQQTCGEGIAQNAALPANLADLFGAVAEILEVHLTALLKSRLDRHRQMLGGPG
jgi:hypothetical protein